MDWTLKAYTCHSGATCEACGKTIAHIFTLESTDGQCVRVGSECANQIIGIGNLQHMKQVQKLSQLAAAQWRKGGVIAYKDETREQYITRKVAEQLARLDARKTAQS